MHVKGKLSLNYVKTNYDMVQTVLNPILSLPVFEGDEHDLRLATRAEGDRDSWIERLHIAGYECMRIQLNSLREQLRDRTGRDPIESGGLAVDEPSVPSAPGN
jgi:hypothetical protein